MLVTAFFTATQFHEELKGNVLEKDVEKHCGKALVNLRILVC